MQFHVYNLCNYMCIFINIIYELIKKIYSICIHLKVPCYC